MHIYIKSMSRDRGKTSIANAIHSLVILIMDRLFSNFLIMCLFQTLQLIFITDIIRREICYYISGVFTHCSIFLSPRNYLKMQNIQKQTSVS